MESKSSKSKNIKKQVGILSRYFLVVFLAGFLLINWQEVSWVFNYKVFSGFVSGIFQKSDFETFAGSQEQGNEIQKNTLEISEIEVSAPLIFVENERDIDKALYQGAVHFPGTALPGNKGQTLILGHSAPQGWPKIKYDWIFSRIEELVEGDEISLAFKGRKYIFVVTGKTILKRGGDIPSSDLTNSENVLVLISCWPPGKDYKRIAVEAVLKAQNYEFK